MKSVVNIVLGTFLTIFAGRKVSLKSIVNAAVYGVSLLIVIVFFVWLILGFRLECSCGRKGYFNFYTSPYDNGVFICKNCALEEYTELPEERKVNFLIQWR